MFFEAMHPAWQLALADQRELLLRLEVVLAERVASGEVIAPRLENIMRALSSDPAEVRVLIVGQDPYPTDGHAIGLSFAVSEETKPLPRSLQNILKELATDVPGISTSGRIERWQDSGVMLLNRHLTTAVGAAGSHSKLGWHMFTDAVIETLVVRRQPLVAILWGNHAAQLESKLTGATVIKSAHPSPLSARRGFFGSKPFSKSNEALLSLGAQAVDWSC